MKGQLPKASVSFLWEAYYSLWSERKQIFRLYLLCYFILQKSKVYNYVCVEYLQNIQTLLMSS